MEKQSAIFLDKDGTLIPNIPYNTDVEKMTLMPGAEDGLNKLADIGYRFVIVSNQSGIARGIFKPGDLLAVEQKMHSLFSKAGLSLAGFFYCPHHPQGTVEGYNIECGCRKPKAGLLTQASECLGIDLKRSWMIGDILNDVEAGNRAGCSSILIDNGGETAWVGGEFRRPRYIARNLSEAADFIQRENPIYHESYLSILTGKI